MHTLNADDVAGVNVRAEFPANANGQSKFSVDLAGQHRVYLSFFVHSSCILNLWSSEKRFFSTASFCDLYFFVYFC